MRRVVRREAFGFIVQPPLIESLVWVARRGQTPSRPLSAPVEAHLSITAACPNRCTHCYESSTPRGRDLGLAHWKGVVDTLASMGVFHCAVGGGEPAVVPWLFDLAAHARRRGLVPNLTTSGATVDERWARRSEVFGQVNVSIDGPRGPRGPKVFAQAVRAAELLRRHRGRVGINCVVTRGSFHHLDELCALAKRLKLSELELLRYKPAGRAGHSRRPAYGVLSRHTPTPLASARLRGGPPAVPPLRPPFDEVDLTPEMYAAIVPTVRRLMLRHRLKIKLDCSMVPAVAMAGIRPGVMELFGASGCEGGNELLAVDARGFVHGCSFDARRECRAGDLRSRWPEARSFARFRRWEERGAKACLDCGWFEICRGGCHVVARHVAGSWYAPDPSCVIAATSRSSVQHF